MKILFDQGTPVAIRNSLTHHIVRTANEEGWSTLSNGDLLRAAEEAGFNMLLTTDTNLPHQQDLKTRKLAVVILSKNRWLAIQRKLPEIVAAINAAKPGTYRRAGGAALHWPVEHPSRRVAHSHEVEFLANPVRKYS